MKLFKLKKHMRIVPTGPFPRDMTLDEVTALGEGCLFCNSSEVYQGALNTNFFCYNCDALYNLATISLPFTCQILKGSQLKSEETS
jgi:hypothetical protein